MLAAPATSGGEGGGEFAGAESFATLSRHSRRSRCFRDSLIGFFASGEGELSGEALWLSDGLSDGLVEAAAGGAAAGAAAAASSAAGSATADEGGDVAGAESFATLSRHSRRSRSFRDSLDEALWLSDGLVAFVTNNASVCVTPTCTPFWETRNQMTARSPSSFKFVWWQQ